MFKKAFPALLFASALFASCSKSSDNPGNDSNTPRPADYLVHTTTSVTYLGGTITKKKVYDFTYNKAANKITVNITDSTGGIVTNDNVDYVKDNNTVNVNHSKDGRIEKFFINPKSTLMDSLWDVTGSKKDVSVYTYTLDAKGRVSSRTWTAKEYIDGKLTGTISPVTYNYTWQNDNLITTVENGVTLNYTYDEKLLAASPDRFTNIYNSFQALYTVNNQIKTVSYYSAGNAYVNTYTYDDKGRISTIEQSGGSGEKFASTYYTYY